MVEQAFLSVQTKVVILTKDEQKLVLNQIIEGNKKYYTLFAVVVMPDYVHMVLQPQNTVTLSRIMKGIKGGSSRKINRQKKLKGSVWLDESYDRIIRDEHEFLEKINYLE